MLTLLPTILLMCGKVNFMNMSRYSDISERTYRRQYAASFPYMALNRQLIELAIPATVPQIGVMDGSFIPKSGKGTVGLDWFYNGSASRSEKGLEISVLAVVDVSAGRGYTLSVQQTPARVATPPKPPNHGIDAAMLAAVSAALQQLPERSTTETEAAVAVTPPVRVEWTRTDDYLEQLRHSQPHLPAAVKYLAVDAAYSKRKFVNGVVALKLHVIGKLRIDANLRYCYEGEQKARGRTRLYDGKVDLTDRRRLTWVSQPEPGLQFYTAIVWHFSLARKIRIALLVDTRKPGKTGLVLLFSTDVDLDAQTILTYYQARFQIEFIFRDGKQFTGLADCQSRHPDKLDFHFNASLTALNLAKYQAQSQQTTTDTERKADVFSMASHKRAAFNDHLLERFISQLDLNPTLIKSHPNYQNLRAYGLLTA
jgi:Transposase DDE domain